MNYKVFDNSAKQFVQGGKVALQNAEFDFENAILNQLMVEGTFVTLKVKTASMELTFVLQDAEVVNLVVNSGAQLVIQGIEYAICENKLYLAIALDKHQDFRFTCSEIKLVDAKK